MVVVVMMVVVMMVIVMTMVMMMAMMEVGKAREEVYCVTHQFKHVGTLIVRLNIVWIQLDCLRKQEKGTRYKMKTFSIFQRSKGLYRN